MKKANLNPGKAVVFGGKAANALLNKETKVNKDHLALKQDGDNEVIEFANEERVFFITNGGAVGLAFVPMRRTAPPT